MKFLMAVLWRAGIETRICGHGRREGRTRLLSWFLVTGTCLTLPGLAPFSFAAGISEHAKTHKAAIAEDIFAGTNVLRIQIEIPQSGLNKLRQTGWGNGRERPIAMATVKEGGVLYTNVAVHLKGSAGSFRSVDANPCLTLNFEKTATGQTFHGLHKLSLNNSAQDRSFLSEKICRELFDAAGVPAPRAGHAIVELNGRNIGLHVLTEGWGKQFLKRYFNDTKGNLYDGGFVRDVTDSLDVNSGDNPNDNSGLRALASAARDPDPATRMARLEKTLDMQRFLSFVAMDVIQCDWDGYAMNHNNWRIFHNLESNKMVFFPHGLDQMFGVQRATPECPILPHMQGLVARAVIGTPEGKRRYLQRVSELYTNVFHVDALLKRVDELAAVINPAIAEYSAQAARRHEVEVENLKRRIALRDESLSRQLSTSTAEPKFGSDGTMKLAGWRRNVRAGEPAFKEEKASDGKDQTLLSIAAPNGDVSASWRTRVLLQEGTYRFEGRIKTTDVKSDAQGGAGARLRISRGTGPRGLSGNTEWQQVAYTFEVAETGTEVEFVCELRASKGEACFDATALQVVRVE